MASFFEIALQISFGLLIVAFLFSFYRLVKGPDIYNRILALDFIATIAMSFILLYSVFLNNSVYFDIAIVISLISFIATVGVSTYLKLQK